MQKCEHGERELWAEHEPESSDFGSWFWLGSPWIAQGGPTFYYCNHPTPSFQAAHGRAGCARESRLHTREPAAHR